VLKKRTEKHAKKKRRQFFGNSRVILAWEMKTIRVLRGKDKKFS